MVREARGTGRGRVLARVVGDLLVTAGVLVLLFAGYALWWTDGVADRKAEQAVGRLRGQWSASTPAPSPAPPPPGLPGIGEDVGLLHVPAMGRGYQVLIRVGTDPDTLADGVAGVYTAPYGEAMPWDREGNFALAAHRDGHGAKFHDLDRVGPGDAVVVETRDRWYVYRVDGVLPETSPENAAVIAPVPVGSPYRSPGRYITLTTCTPEYTSRYRLVVWGSLVREDAVDPARTPPAELR
ncbi:class E sortase [Kitasatospora sp. NPDC049285]|uniref:class E sortase n=1 Tax=Kitasatospora sp. NPDC049285 TaxID=3157096 RepID=UPI0034152349